MHASSSQASGSDVGGAQGSLAQASGHSARLIAAAGVLETSVRLHAQVYTVEDGAPSAQVGYDHLGRSANRRGGPQVAGHLLDQIRMRPGAGYGMEVSRASAKRPASHALRDGNNGMLKQVRMGPNTGETLRNAVCHFPRAQC